MLFGVHTTSTTLLAALGSITANTFSSIYGWIIVAVGIPLGFVVAKYLISLFKHGVSSTSAESVADGPYLSQGDISKEFPEMGDFKGDI